MWQSIRAATVVAGVVLGLVATVRGAPVPQVVVSIAPVHSLVAGVMQGVAEPRLLLPASASPHAYALRPSDAAALARASVVFRVGPDLEVFLNDVLATVADQAHIVSLYRAPGVRLVPYRSAAPEVRPEGSSAPTDEHSHPDVGVGEGSAHTHGHPANTMDMHVWLDPDNARALVEAIAGALRTVDPERSATYTANAERMKTRLGLLDAALGARLAPVIGRPYIVFHDAYRYFEQHYGLSPVGVVTVNPERRPGARTLRAIRQRIETTGAICVFTEPQFNEDLVRALTRDTTARIGVLDPLGVGLDPGVDLYFRLMTNLAVELSECLTDS